MLAGMDFPVDLRGVSFSGRERDRLFLRTAEGAKAFDVASIAGVDLVGDGRSAAAVDLDGDGDLDLVVREQQAPQLRLFRNDGPNGGSIEVRPGRIGANVIASAGGRLTARPVLAGAGFLTQTPPVVIVGLGEAKSAALVQVRLPDKRVIELHDVPAGSLVEVAKDGRATVRPRPPAPSLGKGHRARSLDWSPPTPAELLAALEPSAKEALAPLLAPGKTRVVNLWAPWCKPCRDELPELAKLAAERPNVTVLMLAIDGTPEEIGKAHGALAPSLVNGKLTPEAALALGLGAAVPATLVYGPDDRLVRGFVGPVPMPALTPLTTP